MEVKAKLSYLRQSPRKVRLVADLIRGLDIDRAQAQLIISLKKASHPLLKLLDSAVASAENNFQLKKNNLFIKEVRIDQGPTLGRSMPRAFGRATPIHKKTSHLTIILAERIESKSGHTKKSKSKGEVESVKVVKSLDEIKKETTAIDKDKKLANTKEEKTSHRGAKSAHAKKVFQRKSG
jgi:large subunit ribosomal protein L22